MSYFSKKHFLVQSTLASSLAMLLTTTGGCSQHPQLTNLAYNGKVPALENLPTSSANFRQHDSKLEAMHFIMLAEIAWNRHLAERTLSFYTIALKLYPDESAAARMTELALMSDSFSYALFAATQWASLAPSNMHAQSTSLILLAKADEKDAMQTHLTNLIQLDEDTLHQALSLVTSQLDTQAEKQSLREAIQQAASQDKNPERWLYALAYGAKAAGSMGQALTHAKSLIKQQPESKYALMFYVQTLRANQQQEKSITVLREALQSSPQQHDIRLLLGKFLMEGEEYPRALAHFTHLQQQPLFRQDALLYQAMIHFELREMALAQKILQKIIEETPHHEAGNYYLGQVYELQGLYEQSLAHYQQVRFGQYYLNAQMGVALLTARLGALSEGLTLAHQLIVSYPQHQKPLLMTSVEMLVEANENSKALTLLNQSIEQHPNDTDFLYARSLVAAKLGDFDLTEQDLRVVIELEPSHFDALNALGFTLADRTNRHQEAKLLLDKAILLAPENPSVLDSMGWVLYRLGKYDEAEQRLRRAHALSGDSEIAAHLGEVLWMSGKPEDALSIWKAALADAPEDEVLLHVLKRFQVTLD